MAVGLPFVRGHEYVKPATGRACDECGYGRYAPQHQANIGVPTGSGAARSSEGIR